MPYRAGNRCGHLPARQSLRRLRRQLPLHKRALTETRNPKKGQVAMPLTGAGRSLQKPPPKKKQTDGLRPHRFTVIRAPARRAENQSNIFSPFRARNMRRKRISSKSSYVVFSAPPSRSRKISASGISGRTGEWVAIKNWLPSFAPQWIR